MDFFSEFKEWYLKILEDFKFNYQTDVSARDFLSQILFKKKKEWNLENILKLFKTRIDIKQYIMIYGCGPSLETTVQNLKKKAFSKKFANLAADGASVLLKLKKIPIEATFTDLDGITMREFYYPTFLIVHAHGDNIDKLKYFEKEILRVNNIIGTTQVEPLYNVLNPGGFTDGDRILFFLRSLLKSTHKIFFIGMDFKNIIGKYSKPNMNENSQADLIKIKKLEYAVKLLEWLIERINNEIYFVNSEVVSNKFNYISIKDFMKMID